MYQYRLNANVTPLYIRDLSICGAWYLQGVLEPIPDAYQGTVVKFGGSQKVISRFSTVQGLVSLTPHIVQGSIITQRPNGLPETKTRTLPYLESPSLGYTTVDAQVCVGFLDHR